MNLRAALRSAGIRYRDKPHNPDEVLICCPFCVTRGESPDTRFRCAINVRKNAGNCLNCDWATNINAMQEVSRQVGLDAMRTLVLSTGDAPTGDTIEEKEPEELGPPDGYLPLASYDPAASAFDSTTLNIADPVTQAICYVEKRGISWDQVERHDIGVCLCGRYAYRIIFPVYVIPPAACKDALDENSVGRSQWHGFVARDFTGALDKKVLNASCSMPLFNYQAIGPRSCSLLGHSMTEWQASQVRYSTVISEGIIKALAIERVLARKDVQEQVRGKVVLFPDPDPVGLWGFLKVAWALAPTRPVFFPKDLPGAQADDMHPDKLAAHLSALVPFTPFVEMTLRRASYAGRRFKSRGAK